MNHTFKILVLNASHPNLKLKKACKQFQTKHRQQQTLTDTFEWTGQQPLSMGEQETHRDQNIHSVTSPAKSAVGDFSQICNLCQYIYSLHYKCVCVCVCVCMQYPIINFCICCISTCTRHVCSYQSLVMFGY